jgi:hypothetical protein
VSTPSWWASLRSAQHALYLEQVQIRHSAHAGQKRMVR